MPIRPHQAEDLPDLLARVRQAFAQIDAQSPDNSDILVVSHGLLLSALIYQLAPEQLPLGLLKNTSVTRVDVTDKGMRLRGVNLIRESDILALRHDEPQKDDHQNEPQSIDQGKE